MSSGFGSFASGHRSWRGRKTPPISKPKQTRRWMAVAVMLILLAMLAWRIWKLFLPALHLAVLPIISQDFGKLPLVPYAQPTSQAVMRARVPASNVPLDFLTSESFAQTLAEKLAGVGPNASHWRDSLVLYVCAHGFSDNGEPVLLCSDWLRDPRNPASGEYEVDDLLAKLNEMPVPVKLLILDTGHLSADPRMGMLYNDFPELVAAQVEGSKQPGLWVLISNEVHQRSNVSTQSGQTVFGHFVARGLDGAADSDHDGLLDLNELDDYVRDEVARWVGAATHPQESQRTRLCWGGEQTGKKKLFPVLGPVLRKPAPAATDEKTSRTAPPASFTTPQLAATATRGILVPGLALGPSRAGSLALADPVKPKAADPPAADADTHPPADAGPPAIVDPDAPDPAAPPSQEVKRPASATTDAAPATKPDEKLSAADLARAACDALLEEAWREHDAILDGSKAAWTPVDYAPQIWREYEDWLIGVEQRCRQSLMSVEGAQQKRTECVHESDLLSGVNPKTNFGGYLNRLIAARKKFMAAVGSSEFASADAQNWSRAWKLRNRCVYRARDYLRWQTLISVGSSNDISFRAIEQFLKKTQELNDQLQEWETGTAEPAERDTQSLVRTHAELEKLDTALQKQIDAESNALKLVSPKLRLPLWVTRDPLPAVVRDRLALVKAIDAHPDFLDTANRWSESGRSTNEQEARTGINQAAQLEVLFVGLAGLRSAELTKLPTAQDSPPAFREFGQSLRRAYIMLIEQARGKNGATVRDAQAALRVIDPRDAKTVDDNAGVLSRLPQRRQRQSQPPRLNVADKLELATDGTTSLPLVVVGEGPAITLTVRFDPHRLRTRTATATADGGVLSIPVQPTAAGTEVALLVEPVEQRDWQSSDIKISADEILAGKPAVVDCRLAPPDQLVLSIEQPAGPAATEQQSKLTLTCLANRATACSWILENRSQRARKLTVELYSGTSPPKGKLLAQLEGWEIAPQEKRKLDLLPPGAKKDPAGAPATAPAPGAAAAPAAAPATPNLVESTLTLVLREVGENQAARVESKTIELLSRRPRDFIEARARFQSGEKNKIFVDVSLRPDTVANDAQPVRVQWTPAKDDLPMGAKRKEQVELTNQAPNGELFAEVLAEPGKSIRVELTVDDYPRALIFDVPCDKSDRSVASVRSPTRVRIAQPHSDQDGAAVAFASDKLNAPDLPAWVEIQLDVPEDKFKSRAEGAPRDRLVVGIAEESQRHAILLDQPDRQLQTFVADRQVTFDLELSPDSGLRLRPTVTDIQFKLKQLPVGLFQNQLVSLEAQLYYAESARRVIADDAVTIAIDSEPPHFAAPVSAPSESAIGQPIQFIARLAPDLTGINDVEFAEDANHDGIWNDDEKPKRVLAVADEPLTFSTTLKGDATKEMEAGQHQWFFRAHDGVGYATEKQLVQIKLLAPVISDPAPTAPDGIPAAVPGNAPNVTLRGRVTALGKGTRNILVEVTGDLPGGKKKRAQIRSGADGDFEFRDLPAGTYVIKASGEGYPAVSQKLDLSKGKAPEKLEIHLK